MEPFWWSTVVDDQVVVKPFVQPSNDLGEQPGLLTDDFAGVSVTNHSLFLGRVHDDKLAQMSGTCARTCVQALFGQDCAGVGHLPQVRLA